MKKSVSTVLLVILICSAYFQSFAQQSKLVRSISPSNVAFAEYSSIKAFSDGRGVFISWETRSELNNIGFLVYRLGDNGYEQITQLVPGSYMKNGNRILTNQHYELYDQLGSLRSSYMIQTQLLYGNQTSRAFVPKWTSNFQADTGHTKAELEAMAGTQNGNLRKDSLALPSDLQATVDGSVLPPDPETQHRIMTQGGVKFDIKKDGMYRVTRAELQTAGFDVNSDPTNWRLFMDGNEQAINVAPGGQYIEFYGKGIDVRETDKRTYFLIADSAQGKRIISKFLGNIGGNVVSHNYRYAIEKKERLGISFNQFIKNGDEENYFGRPVYSTFVNCSESAPCLSFDLNGLDLSGLNAVVTVKLQGIPNTPPAHSVRVLLNGEEIGLVNGNGVVSFSSDISVSPGILLEQGNILRLATTTSSDTVFFDSVKVTYSKKYSANQNSVRFFTPGYRKIDVEGFTSANIRIFDTTLDGNPQLITNLPITQNGATYSVKMPSNRPAVMFGIEDSGLLQVPSITPFNPSSLGTPSNQADMVIISYSSPEFMTASETWAAYRRSSAGGSFTVKVIDVADLYDEFSFGEHSAMAIYHFLQYVKNNWQNPRPHYVMLMGDASTDARNYVGLGYNDLVPTMHVGLIFEDTGSDEALADFNHDGVAEMAIGRVPARTLSVINTVFHKTTLFETTVNQSLDRGGVCAFDRPDGFDFEAMCHALMDQLPAGMPKTYINKMIPPNNTTIDPNGHTNLINALNLGPYVVNYSGHGTAGIWSSTNFFNSNDAAMLTNLSNPSIYTMLTCYNGYFMWALNDSLGEALLKAPGGAVATWASTTETTPDYQLLMGSRFYLKTGEGNIRRLGDLVLDAKAIIAGSDVGYSWALLGDPALAVRQ